MLVRFHEIFQLELLSLRWGLPHEQFSRFVFDQFLVLRFIFAAAGFGSEFLDFQCAFCSSLYSHGIAGSLSFPAADWHGSFEYGFVPKISSLQLIRLLVQMWVSIFLHASFLDFYVYCSLLKICVLECCESKHR